MSSSSHPAAGSPRFIDNGRIELVSVIGTGAYGVVHVGVDASVNPPCYRAVKCLRRHGLDARQRHFQRREIALHRLASAHSSIVTMDRLVEEGDYLYVVMDFGEDGDLFAMITDRQRYVGDDELIRNVFLQLLDGVAYLHHLGISHRDIKPENIVCSQGGERVQICDFGLATSEAVSSEFGCGSTFYIAPECLGDWYPDVASYPTKAGDVWSLGVILVNLVCGRNPWRIASPSDESFNAFLQDPEFLRRILPVSSQCLDILTRIFTVDPAERISLCMLRHLIEQIDSFSMGEEELRAAHATAKGDAVEFEEWIDDEAVFSFDQETPSLRADSGSPSPPTNRSRSGSSDSLPPTPLLSAEGASCLPDPAQTAGQVWELFQNTDKAHYDGSELRATPVVAGASPFFQ
ncbi:Negative regulator of sexual conjugation and meiosis [Saitozyma sp. JCM 24511]|nr:Negative regulator of sexual conjugation and meiosis [Saitozyma sp. JCM 24511]